MKSEDIFNQYEKFVAPNYGRTRVALTEGKGSKVKDADGKTYLDLITGLGVNILGHSPSAVEKALTKQAKKLVHTSNLFYTVPQGKLAQKLCQIAFPGQALFVNSGAEAVESALKLARKYQHDKGTGRYEFIAMENSFHGRTYGALSATGQKKYQNGFAPLLPGFKHVPFGNIAEVEKAITPQTAAIIVEPVQGEGGVNPVPDGFLTSLRKLCDKHGILLIFDEVQCGMGRTGKWFAWQHEGVQPDIMTVAKGLAGGFPIGAMIAKKEIMATFGPGTHASTFGGGPLACVSALAIIDTIEKKGILKNVVKISKETAKELEKLQKELKDIKEIRIKGLMIGIELDIPPGKGGEIVSECLQEGLIINCIQDKVIRFLPPLNVTSSDMRKGLTILKKVLCKKIS